MRAAAAASLAAVTLAAMLAASGDARAAADPDSPDAPRVAIVKPQRPVRFTGALLVGSGYGWTDGTADVNGIVPVSGGHWARLGHLAPEVGLLFPRVHLFVSLGGRIQAITGTTSVFTDDNEFNTRSSVWAVFTRVGWFPRAPEARWQPYLALSSGYGRIAHVAAVPGNFCGPLQDQPCVDTITSEPWFAGAGTGLRWRIIDHLHALLALEAQFGRDQQMLNLDLNVGLGFVI
jgi:hypothetical protein